MGAATLFEILAANPPIMKLVAQSELPVFDIMVMYASW
jgi:hypothetical protein